MASAVVSNSSVPCACKHHIGVTTTQRESLVCKRSCPTSPMRMTVEPGGSVASILDESTTDQDLQQVTWSCVAGDRCACVAHSPPLRGLSAGEGASSTASHVASSRFRLRCSLLLYARRVTPRM